MAHSIKQSNLDVNSNSHLLNNKFSTADKHRIVSDFIKDKALTNNEKRVVESIINCSNSIGDSDASQQTLSDKSGISLSTLKRALRRLQQKNVVGCKKNGWKKTNTISLLPLKTKLNHKEVKMTCYLNPDLNLRDHTNTYTNYSEYIHFNDLQNKPKLQEARATVIAKPESKRVDKRALHGLDPDAEVIRVCLLYKLTEEQTKYAVIKMRKREGMHCAASCLSNLVKKLSTGEWSTPKPKSDFNQDYYRERARRDIEATKARFLESPFTPNLIRVDEILAGVKKSLEC